MFRKIFLSLLFSVFIFAGVASAHGEEQEAQVVFEDNITVQSTAGMLPGNPFYFLEILSESIGNFFVFNEIKKAERLFQQAEERLVEAEELATLGKFRRAEKATERYEKDLEKALKKAEKAKEKGKNTDEILAKMAESTVKHQIMLVGIYEKVSDKEKESIESVMGESIKGYDRAFEAISEEKQIELEVELEQIFEEVDVVLEDLRVEGVLVPKIKDREHRKDKHEEDSMEDDFEDLGDELDDGMEGFEDDFEDLDDDINDIDNLL